MILSDKDIKRKLKNNEISIAPFDEQQIEPASIDLRLGSEFSVIETSWHINKLDEKISYKKVVDVGDEGYIIAPNEFVLATTKETVDVGRFTAFVEGRSSIGRLGLFIQNAGWVDCGFKGQITLELFNASNCAIQLVPDTRICQIVLAATHNIPEQLYNGKYQNQQGAVGSKIYQDRENKKEAIK